MIGPMTEEVCRIAQPLSEVDGHRLGLFVRGPERLSALMNLIDRAESRLQLFFYLFANDDHGILVLDALIRAQARGVDVSLLIDGFGSEGVPDSFFLPLQQAGGRFCRFLPGFGRKYVLRNHQKLAIADRRYALVGGCNVANSYFVESPTGDHWVDLILGVEGPASARLADYFDDLERWVHNGAGLRRFRLLLQRHSQFEADKAVACMFAGPFTRLSPLTRDLRRRIATAMRMDIVAAYFAPPPGMIRRLGRLARRGKLRVMTASRTDNLTTIRAARHCYERLLRRGAVVMEYQPARLHMKLIVADDHVYIGSANFDVRSLFINAELMIRVNDPHFAANARALVDALGSESRSITLAKLERAGGFMMRLLWRISYYIVVTLDPTVTRRLLRRVFQAEQAGESSFQAQ